MLLRLALLLLSTLTSVVAQLPQGPGNTLLAFAR
jgi:hypothetical protein